MTLELLVVLLAVVALLSGAARRVGIPAPFVLVITGLALGYLPGLPRV
jgi:hypothetical protein